MDSKKEQILRLIDQLFSDTTVSKQQTKDDLLDIAQECEMKADTIEPEGD